MSCRRYEIIVMIKISKHKADCYHKITVYVI